MDYIVGGVFKIKKYIPVVNLAIGGVYYGKFRCCNILYDHLVHVYEGGKDKLYYADAYDLSEANRTLHVYTRGDGWVKDCYRTIVFGSYTTSGGVSTYSEVEEDFFSWLTSSATRFLYSWSGDTISFNAIGVRNISGGSWLFPDSIDYPLRSTAESIECNVPFRANYTWYSLMKWKGNTLYYDDTPVYTKASGWQGNGYRVVEFQEQNSVTYRDYQFCAFIIAMASENVAIRYANNAYICSFSAGNQATIPCRGNRMYASLVIEAGPHVGVCRVYYGRHLIEEYDVTRNITNTAQGRKITVPIEAGQLMLDNIRVSADGNVPNHEL